MLRLASLLLIANLFQNLLADEFSNCHKQVRASYKFSHGNHLYKTAFGWLAFSEKPLKHYLRSEPLLGLYLLNDKQKAKALKVITKHPKNVAAITREAVQKNRILNEGIALDQLAPLKYESYQGTALFGSCCTLRAFVTSHGIVTSDYMLRFLRDKKPFATAGIRLKELKGKILVQSVNPFFESNPFKKGDEILYMDGKKHSLEKINKKILFSKVGSKHYFRVKRYGKKIALKLFFKERLGGGVLGETYLEQYGFLLSPDLEAVFIDKNSYAEKLGLKSGDLLKAINNKSVTSDASVRALFQNGIPKEKMRLLFERIGLQFNIFVPSNVMLTLQK